jgi:cysteine synthase
VLLPRELTGVDANIVVMTGNHFPTGSHKVGAVYSILIEAELLGDLVPGTHTTVYPSTGNYGIGGAWVGPRMGYRSLVVLPAEMSAERFEKIRGYGAEVIATPGCESNVKEIFDEVRRLATISENRILNQFAEFGNYRFHYGVTGQSAAELVRDLAARGIGGGRLIAVVSALGSAGTIAAGERLKQLFPGSVTVGLEPIQCPTLFDVGFGGHRIEGIGDKHVTWIHNVHAMDLLVCIDDGECLEGLELLELGGETLERDLGLDTAAVRSFRGTFGVSSVCNILGAIKTARFLGLGRDDTVVTVATDGFDRYPSVIRRLRRERGEREDGPLAREAALRRIDLFRRAKLDWILEGSRPTRTRWHNQKYYTWCEQQGKSVAEIRALESPELWLQQQARIAEIDRKMGEARIEQSQQGSEG